jgi:hypothetical protein
MLFLLSFSYWSFLPLHYDLPLSLLPLHNNLPTHPSLQYLLNILFNHTHAFPAHSNEVFVSERKRTGSGEQFEDDEGLGDPFDDTHELGEGLIGLSGNGVDGQSGWTAEDVDRAQASGEEGSARGACGEAEGHGSEVDV